MNKTLLLVLVVLAVLAVIRLYLLFAGEPEPASPAAIPAPATPAPVAPAVEPSPQQTIADIVRSANDKLPAMVDKQTRLDRVEAGPGAQLSYHYSLPDMAPPQVDGYWLSREVQPKVTRDVCDTPAMRRLLAAGATLVYAYKDKHGASIGRFEIKDADCKRIGF